MKKNLCSSLQLIAWLSCCAIFARSANAVIFTNDAVIAYNDFSYDGADVVMSNCVVNIDGAHTFASLGIFTGGTLTHSNGFMGMSLTVTGNVNVAVGGTINVNAKGYFDSAGPGIGGGIGGSSGGGGGGYGGYGGNSSSNSPGGAVYGAFSQPTDFGSPGGGGGGTGGGAVKITADGTITINGSVSANGANGLTNRSGGGSGGSIWLTAARFAGSGSITADGGAGEPPHGGGGGGGRIALEFGTNEFSGTLFARGGLGATAGGAGTIYTQGTNQTGLVLVDNGSRAGTNTLLQIANSSDLVVQGKAAVVPAGNQLLRNVLVTSTGKIFFSTNQYITAFGDVIIEPGGGILADGNGYTGGQGPGAGSTSNFGGLTTGGGGGHGGFGSPSTAGVSGGAANGDSLNPVNQGSGGGSGSGFSPFNLGGAGGGAIRLQVFGRLQIDGKVSADGRAGPAPGSGGGAGGSIWLTAQTLAGSGIISANGGNGNGQGGGGGGGRIVITPSTNNFAGSVSTFGGQGTAGVAGAGTICTTLFIGGIDRVSLVIDNAGAVGNKTTLGTSQFTGTMADLDIVHGGALIWPNSSPPSLRNLLIGTNSSLIYTNSNQFTMSVASNATIEAGGWLYADGASSPGTAPGVNASAPNYGQIGSGGGHGGLGGTTIVGTPGGGMYGTVSQPTTFGSRGGSGGNGSFGGAGGGSIQMNVSRTLRVDGKISANGLDGPAVHSGGGSGGSVNLTATTLTGSGTISANGGGGNGVGGGGAGGRVAVTCSSNLFAGVIAAFGASGGGISGGAGTVFLRNPNNPNITGRVIVDNAGQTGFTPYGFTSPSLPDLTVSGRSILLLTNNSMNFANLLIRSNSAMIVTNNNTAFALTSSSNVIVEAGSFISADGGGFGMGQGTGLGTTINTQLGLTGSGAGYGGIGGNSAGGAAGGTTYGSSMSEPTDRGSGGGGNSSAAGGAGGGALFINAARTMLIDGTISANGRSAPGFNAGGGSGGSLWLNAGTLAGTGSIIAHGGSGNGSGGGGGAGGRISLQYITNNLFTGLAAAYGGVGYFPGGPGTVFTKGYSNSVAQVTLQGNAPGFAGLTSTTNRYGLTIGNGVTAPVNYSSAGTLTLANLFISSGGTLAFSNGVILLGLPTFGALTVEGNATIQAGGLLTADGVGGLASGGSGAGISSTASGGGYGGLGVRVGTTIGSGAYGSATQPSTTGSGGGPSPGIAAIGGRGGGVIRLTVNGLLQLDGRISANGLPGSLVSAQPVPNSAGGGSGGSVWLTTGGIAGAGTITANGGDGFNAGGGGGGGRIALYYQTNNFSGTIRAFGGNNGVSNNSTVGGAGTIYLAGPIHPFGGQIIVDNGGRLGTNTWVSDQGSFDLTVRAGAVYAGLPTYNYVVIGSNGWMLLTNQLVTVYSNATIQAGGGIIADGTGSESGTGTGAGRTSQSQTGSGGGYGGYGAASGTASGGTAYNSAANPLSLGSGGGAGVGLGGSGGGVVRLSVSGALTNDGRISADGVMGDYNGGGGSGGSIQLTARRFAGTGRISANGAPGAGPGGGGGGGGRISIIYGLQGQISPTNNFTGILQALGGASGPTNPAAYGGAGTILLSSSGAADQLLVDNGGHSGTNTLLGEPLYFDLTIRGGAAAVPSILTAFIGNLLIESNSWFVVANNFLNLSGTATINTGGGIIADRKGFVGGQGPGAGAIAFSSFYGNTGGGGGHGGYGAASVAGAAGGNTYDFITTFSNGSGGGGVPTFSAGSGGGVVHLNASSLVLNGRISADGGDGTFQHGGGGAGGGVSLSVGTISGNGIISANGGAANGVGGGGGGGRVDVLCDTNHFQGAIRAWGGVGGGGVGGAGTVLTRIKGIIDGQLTVANGALTGTNTPLPILTNIALTVSDGAVVHPANGYFVLSNLIVGAGGLVTSFQGQTNLNISVVGNANIATGGALATDGMGFAQASGPGAGLSAGGYGSGAGYGGPGGDSSTAPGGFVYGSAVQPIDQGSGGGFGSGPTYPGSQGGGAIRLNIGGTLTVNGRLSAGGSAGVQDNAGGGSGGSIWVDTGFLNGNGQISADGGDGELYGGGGGGGGRIAIYRHRNASPTNNFTGLLSAFGGEGAQWGGDGTIFLSSGQGGLQVVSQTPTGAVTGAVTFVDFEFNGAVNPYTFSPSDVLLTKGGLTVSNVFSITTLSPTSFRVNLQALAVAGDYQIVVGPQIENLYGQTMSQVYTGALSVVLPVVQGTVTDTNGAPVSGVLLQPSGQFAAATTDANGNYAIGFLPGASFTITPSKPGLMFAPGIRSYNNSGVSISNQNFVAVETIATSLTSGFNNGSIDVSWYGMSGVNYQLLISSNLVNWVPIGGLMAGGNSTILFSLPVTFEPAIYFRVRASN